MHIHPFNGPTATNFTQAGKITIDSSLFSVLNGRMVQDYENISKINAHLFLISVDDGFVIFNKDNSVKGNKKLAKVFIGRNESP